MNSLSIISVCNALGYQLFLSSIVFILQKISSNPCETVVEENVRTSTSTTCVPSWWLSFRTACTTQRVISVIVAAQVTMATLLVVVQTTVSHVHALSLHHLTSECKNIEYCVICSVNGLVQHGRVLTSFY